MIDLSKQYRTRGGQSVVLLGRTRDKFWPIVGAVNFDERWVPISWSEDGEEGDDDCLDLVEAPRKHTAWQNVYVRNCTLSTGCALHSSKEDADKYAAPSRIACIKIEFEEGEGL